MPTPPVASNLPLGGTSTLSVDGVPFLLGEEFEWSPSTPERATVRGQSGVYGFTEKPRPGHMKGSAYDYNGNSITNIGNIEGSTLIANLRNGKSIMLNAGWNIEPPVVNAADGKFEFNIESADVREL